MNIKPFNIQCYAGREKISKKAKKAKQFSKLQKSVAIWKKSAIIANGGIAQLGEHMHHTHGVAGSSPVVSIYSAAIGRRVLLRSIRQHKHWCIWR